MWENMSPYRTMQKWNITDTSLVSAHAQHKGSSLLSDVTYLKKSHMTISFHFSYSFFHGLSVFWYFFLSFFLSMILHICLSRKKNNAYLPCLSTCYIRSPLCFKNHQRYHHMKICNPQREFNTIINDPLEDQPAHFKVLTMTFFA